MRSVLSHRKKIQHQRRSQHVQVIMDDRVAIIQNDQLEDEDVPDGAFDIPDGKVDDVSEERKKDAPDDGEDNPDGNFAAQRASVESADLPELRVYPLRWYILALFSAMACLQCVVWNTWGPIETGARFAFGWDEATVPMFANWGTIMFVASVVPLSKFVEIDLRNTVLLVSGFMAVGTVLRLSHLVTANPTVFLTSCHICAILNGIAGVTVMAAPPLISSTWFPTSERTTATAINQASNALGNGIAMLVGPYIVHYKKGTEESNNPKQYSQFSNNPNSTAPELFYSMQTPDEVKKDIDVYMDILAACCVLLFGLFIAYFPSKPAHPPAPSSAIQRTDFLAGIKAMCTNKDVLLSCLAYSISQGVMGAWMSVMVNQIGPLGYSDQEIGMMGLASVISQCIMSMAVGYIMDHLKHKMKMTILIILCISTCGFVWLMLMCLPGSGVPHSSVSIYLAIIIATSLNYSCCPLFFEMTVELAYPTNEGTVAGFLTAVNNLVGMTFLFLFFIPSLQEGNSMWMSYTLVGCTFIAIPATALVKEQYNRSNVDEAALNIDF